MKNTLHPALNVFMLIVCLGIFVYSSWQLIGLINLKFNSNTAKGVIKGYYTKKGDAKFIWNRDSVYAPVFTFINKNEKKIEVISNNYKKRMKYKKGDTVTVFYNENKPEKAQIDDSFPWTRHIMLTIAGIIGLFYTLSAYFGYKI